LIDGEVVALEIGVGPRRQPVAERRHLGQPQAFQDIRGEGEVAFDQLIGDLMHLRGLIHRPADEQHSWPFHSVGSSLFRAAILAAPYEREATAMFQRLDISARKTSASPRAIKLRTIGPR
jgi:hypothetical protein